MMATRGYGETGVEGKLRGWGEGGVRKRRFPVHVSLCACVILLSLCVSLPDFCVFSEDFFGVDPKITKNDKKCQV